MIDCPPMVSCVTYFLLHSRYKTRQYEEGGWRAVKVDALVTSFLHYCSSETGRNFGKERRKGVLGLKQKE